MKDKIEIWHKISNQIEFTLIEKLIFCLDDYHFNTFTEILNNLNARLSVKLVSAIRFQFKRGKQGKLCKEVYGDESIKSRQAFNQLASYTFKLSYYLAINYPGYLWSNINVLQNLINEGKVGSADFLSDILIDVAEKTEDYTTLKYVYQLKSQQAFLVKDVTRGNRFLTLLMKTLDEELLLNNLHYILRKYFNINSEKITEPAESEKYIAYIREHLNHPRATVRIFALYTLLYIRYYFQPKDFFGEKTLRDIEWLEKEMTQHCYVVFPPLVDVRSSMNFLKLNSSIVNLDTLEGQKELRHMQQHYSKVLFWKTYINVPELHMITVKTTFFLSKYSHCIHEGTPDIPVHEREEIEALKKRCEEVLAMPAISEKGHSSDKLYTSITYAALLLLGSEKDVKKSVEFIESLLFSYQQVNINASLDSIYLCLILGYFALKEYNLCSRSFVRYSKLSKGKPLHEDNDLSIHIVYYTSQFINTGRKQYLAKLQRCYDIAFQNDFYSGSRKLLNAYAASYKLKFQSDFFVLP